MDNKKRNVQVESDGSRSALVPLWQECVIVTNSNLVLADCPQMMEESTMKQSDKITALYCRLSRTVRRRLPGC